MSELSRVTAQEYHLPTGRANHWAASCTSYLHFEMESKQFTTVQLNYTSSITVHACLAHEL